MFGSWFTDYFIISQCLIKISSGKMSFLFHPDILLPATNHTSLNLSWVKEKDKNEVIDWLQKFSSGLELTLFIPPENR